MAYEIPGKKITVMMAASYAAGQYRATTLNSSGLGAVPAAGAKIIGIVQNKPADADAGEIMTSGISKMEAGAAIAAGADVAVDSSGRGVTAVAGDEVIGQAMEAAGASGVIFPLDLDRGGVVPA